MWARALILLCLASLTGSLWAQPQPRPIRRPPNNQLAIEGPDAPPNRSEAPLAVTGEARNLVFHTSPLSGKGLLSQQVEDAIKALDRANGNATILKLRAFVSGGDLRRVQTIVHDIFTSKKWPLPVITTIQVGALPLEGAQVVIESVSEDKRSNGDGVQFFPASEAATGTEAVALLRAGMGASTALRITCFADSLAEAEAARAAAAQQFPKAAGVFVQATRYTLGTRAACEGVSAGTTHRGKLAFAAGQLAYGESDEDLHLAFDRLERALGSVAASATDAAMLNVYGVTRELAGKAAALGGTAPQSAVFIEGLPALDATLAVEAMAPVR